MTNNRSITFNPHAIEKTSNTRAKEREGETNQYMVHRLGLKRDPHRCQQQKNLHIILQNDNEMKIRATRMLATLISDVGTLKRNLIYIK